MTLELGQVKRERERLMSELQAARQLSQSSETADVAVQARHSLLCKLIRDSTKAVSLACAALLPMHSRRFGLHQCC